MRLLKIMLIYMPYLFGAPLARQDGDHQVALRGCSGSSGCFDSSLRVFCIVIVPTGLMVIKLAFGTFGSVDRCL